HLLTFPTQSRARTPRNFLLRLRRVPRGGRRPRGAGAGPRGRPEPHRRLRLPAHPASRRPHVRGPLPRLPGAGGRPLSARAMRIIVIGAGEVGYHIAELLSHHAHEILVIERQPDVVQRLDRALPVHPLRAPQPPPPPPAPP